MFRVPFQRLPKSKDFPSAASEDIPVQLTLERPARLRPGHLWVPARILTFVVWIGAAIMLAFGFIPGLFTPVESSLYNGQLPFNYSPIWPLLLGLAVAPLTVVLSVVALWASSQLIS